ncbi:MAG: SDR family oxidoreductase [Candidatus Helarchaeota archaeon]|nr:SDR family oxidoreductase [Candidatus Helarchaeota archaeon]
MGSEQKWVLVTGASTGIGRAVTEYLASHGFSIYAGARKSSDLEELAKIEHVTPLQLDVTKDQDVITAVDFVKKQGTGIFALVNNAGIASAGPLMDITEEELREQLEVNLIGVHRVTKAFFPLLLASKGRIMMMSSNSGFFAAPFFGPYNASKFALEGYADSLRRELLLYDVKVVILQPGNINTPIWKKGEQLLDKYPDSMFKVEARKLGEYAINKGNTRGLPPQKVAETVYKALTKKQPKLRYLIAPDRLRNFFLKRFPASWVDNIIKGELEKLKSTK